MVWENRALPGWRMVQSHRSRQILVSSQKIPGPSSLQNASCEVRGEASIPSRRVPGLLGHGTDLSTSEVMDKLNYNS